MLLSSPILRTQPGRAPRGPVAGLVVLLGFVTLWALAASWFLVFRDDFLARVADQQRAIQTAYDVRVGTLQTEIDRALTERVRTRDGIENRIARLVERQALIEKRQGLLDKLGDGPVTTGSIAPPPLAIPSLVPEPVPASDTLELRTKDGDRAQATEIRQALDVALLETRLDASTARQTRALDAIADAATQSAARFRGLIVEAGIEPSRVLGREPGVGGPLVPMTADSFEGALAKVERSKADEDRLRRGVAALPLRQPLRKVFALSSSFGPRVDPFTRGLAMHTGLDMRTDYGAAARATAAGRVVSAEHAGGYGNLVEVDHGHGLVTRYAHLASFSVTPGQRIAAGTIVGRVGSTGRSTGNHLHYETRIDGEPVDPQTFLRAGEQLEFPD